MRESTLGEGKGMEITFFFFFCKYLFFWSFFFFLLEESSCLLSLHSSDQVSIHDDVVIC